MKIILLLLFLSACYSEAVTVADGGTAIDASPTVAVVIPLPDNGGSQGGYLPPGYRQRQCEWDGCGPIPDRRGRVIDPVEDAR